MNALLQRFASLGDRLLEWVLWMNAWTAIVLLGAVIADRLLARRVGAAWRLALYSVVLARLFFPVGWAAPVGVLSISDAPFMAHAAPVATAAPARPAPAQDAPPSIGPSMAPPSLSAAAVGMAYAGGVLVLLLLWARDHARIARTRRECRPLDTSQDPRTPLLAHPTAGPMLVGIVSPRVIIPEHLLAPNAAPDLACVLRHEAAHARRRDHLLAPFLHVVVIACWPIVPLWVAASRVRSLMEQAADERSVAGEPPARREEYAHALVRIADALRRAPNAAGALSFGRGLRPRLRALRFTSRWRSPAQGAAVVVSCSALLACAGVRPGAADAGPTIPGGVVELALLSAWPDSPDLKAHPAPSSGVGAPEPHTLSAQEAGTLIARGAVLTHPRLLLASGNQGTVRVGNTEPGAAAMNGYAFNVRLLESDEERSIVSVQMREMVSGVEQDRCDTGRLSIPAGRWARVVVPGLVGEPARLLLISVAARPVPAPAAIRPADPQTYPIVMCSITLERLDRRVTFESLLPDLPAAAAAGSLITSPRGAAGNRLAFEPLPGDRPGPIPWARTLPATRVPGLSESLATLAGGVVLTSPSVLSRPGERAEIATDFTDKAGASLQGNRFVVRGLPEGDGVRLSLQHSMRTPRGDLIEVSSMDGWVLGPGEAAAYLQPPAIAGDDHWYVVVVTARVIRSEADYPYQTFKIPDPE